jgi:mono/diheme cytochrome c family protein
MRTGPEFLAKFGFIFACGILPVQIAAGQTPAASAAASAATLNRYCTTCHNARLKTGGVVLDPASLSRIGADAEFWEKVDWKLRSRAMPPAGMPRPDESTYNSLTSFLENDLDRAAAAKPNAGELPPLHRLSRTEYKNAIRDLLGLESLPKEMDFDLLLPPDNVSSGFDNIADLLFVSPSTMERYLDAARKISRFAVGDPNIPAMVNIYRLSPEQPQDARVDELPFGTRGGLAVRNTFPVDGEYSVKLELTGAAREAHQLEISVDGERVQLATIGGPAAGGSGGRGGRGGRGRGGAQDKPLEFRFPVKAGEHLVGITFIEHTEARDEAVLRPRMRGRGTQPAIVLATLSGPYGAKNPGESPSRQRIFACHPNTGAEENPCANKILSALARRAYRRPVTDSDLDDLMPFYKSGRSEGDFDLGIERALERLLISPQFLFRIERDPAGAVPGKPFRISDLELASRLSFFLWSSIPDDELLDIASRGNLHNPAVLEQQVKRMLADPRSESMVTNFAEQWLFLRDLENKQPDEILFPDFDETLRAAMRRETDLFLNSVLRENRSVLDLITANYSFLNERLAKHYGIPNIQGSYFRRVTFPEGSVRGGLLGQGSILTITSYSTRTSPVVRGKWVLQNLLSSAPPPPPANVPALKTEGAAPGETLSMRQAMVEHRANPACAGCHARMDPIGFAMENFDAVGRWRDRDADAPIDASGVFPDGSKFSGVAGLKKELLNHPEQFVTTVTQKLLMYAIGRNLQYYDEPAVRAIVRESAGQNFTFSSLVLGVVKSVPFTMRQARDSGAKTVTAEGRKSP